MAKLHGQRMKLGEVEVLLRRNLPDSVEAAMEVITPASTVYGHPELVLVAFINSPKSQKDSAIKELQTHLQTALSKALPGFMVPRIYICLDSMPHNSSGKLDRARLRDSVSSLTIGKLVAQGDGSH